jgi:hypothetical protein
VQDHLGTPFQDIALTSNDPNKNFRFTELIQWISDDLHQRNTQNMLITSHSDLEKYCEKIGNTLYTQINEDFEQREYLPRLHKAKKELREEREQTLELRQQVMLLERRLFANTMNSGPSSGLRFGHQNYTDDTAAEGSDGIKFPSGPPGITSGLRLSHPIADDRRSRPNFKAKKGSRSYPRKAAGLSQRLTSRPMRQRRAVIRHEAPPEVNPLEGVEGDKFGKVVGQDEVGEVFDYSNLNDTASLGRGDMATSYDYESGHEHVEMKSEQPRSDDQRKTTVIPDDISERSFKYPQPLKPHASILHENFAISRPDTSNSVGAQTNASTASWGRGKESQMEAYPAFEYQEIGVSVQQDQESQDNSPALLVDSFNTHSHNPFSNSQQEVTSLTIAATSDKNNVQSDQSNTIKPNSKNTIDIEGGAKSVNQENRIDEDKDTGHRAASEGFITKIEDEMQVRKANQRDAATAKKLDTKGGQASVERVEDGDDGLDDVAALLRLSKEMLKNA